MRQTKRRQKAKSGAASAPKATDDNAVPADIDAFRNMLARRISGLISDQAGRWRGCPERSCRRARRCAAPRGRCTNAGPRGEAKPDQVARTKALFQRLIKERLAQIEAERGAAE